MSLFIYCLPIFISLRQFGFSNCSSGNEDANCTEDTDYTEDAVNDVEPSYRNFRRKNNKIKKAMDSVNQMCKALRNGVKKNKTLRDMLAG